jgi:predicted MFS family arabinose efflux permease
MATQRLCDAMLPELARTFSTSLAQAAQVVSLFAVVYGLCQLVYGPLGDRWGKFRLVTWATLACGVGNLWALFADSLATLVMARMLVALFAAAIIPLTLAWIGDVVPYAQRQETLARVGLGTTLGITGGQLFGGLFTDTVGWRWAFAFMLLLFTIAGGLLWFDARRQHLDRANALPAREAPSAHFVEQALQIITGRWSRVVLVVAVIEGAAGFGVLAIWASHLHHARGLSLFAAGAVVALFGLGGMLYMASARRLIGRLGERGLAHYGVLLLGVSATVIALVPAIWPQLPASLLAGFGFFMFHNTMQVNATQMAPQARGTAVSLFASALFVGQSIGVLLAAALVERVGSSWVILLGAVVLVCVGSYFARALRLRENAQGV